MCNRLVTVKFLILLLVVSAGRVHSAGFAIMQQGTSPMGQGNAFVAQADDPSAVFFNPAGIVQLDGGQAYLGSTLIAPRVTYNGPDNQDEATVAKIYTPPYAYLTQQISPQIYFGLGIFSPFGLSTVWEGDWEGRYLGTYSSLQTFNLNPNLAFKKGDLAVSAGLNVLRADLELKKKFPLTPYPDGESKLTDDTWGYGYNLGLLYHVNDSWQLGLSYRSKIKLSFDDGDADFEVPAPLKSVFPDTKGKGDLDLPPSLTAGISFKPDNKWTLEFDIAWIGWSTYDEIKVKFKDPVNGQYSSVQPKKWEDVFSYRFGVRYRMSDRYTLRAGYVFDKAPVPDSTLDPQLPDGDRHVFTAGLDWKLWDKTVLGFAYNFIYGEERRKDNEIMPYLPEHLRANGNYKQRVHSVGLSLHYRF
jgi:long-chain fatty acid transport protein